MLDHCEYFFAGSHRIVYSAEQTARRAEPFPAKDGEHCRKAYIRSEKAEPAIDGFLNYVNNFGSKTRIRCRGERTAEGMIANKACSVCSGQKHKDVLQAGAELCDRHICAADKTVTRADDRADSGNLP